MGFHCQNRKINERFKYLVWIATEQVDRVKRVEQVKQVEQVERVGQVGE
jgi:hypothetical protein